MNPDTLTKILYAVQARLHTSFDPVEVFETVRTTVRKAELTGKGERYVPVLFENELEDLAMRKEINKGWRNEKCAQSAATLPV